MIYTIRLEQLSEFVCSLLPRIKARRVVALYGDLGTGKTALVSEFCRQIGTPEVVQSPTFTYLNSYRAADGTLVYHFDLYRLKFLHEFFTVGFDEYLSHSDAIVFIEWPEIIENILPPRVLRVHIQHTNNPDVRHITIDGV